MERPTWLHGYFPINNDGYTTQLFRSGGYTVTSLAPGPCRCCAGFNGMMECQYGKPCSKNICGMKPNFVGVAGTRLTFPRQF